MGLPGLRMLESEDPFEVLIMEMLAEGALDYHRKRDERLANSIAFEVSKLFKK